MKYLIWLVVVVAGIWWIRQKRKTPAQQPRQTTDAAGPSAESGPQVMTPCTHCGVHFPESEAIQGAQGLYCSEAHRQRQEG
jgi:uncharacterized protein